MIQSQYTNLVALSAYPFPVYASSDVIGRAQAIAGRCQRAYQFLHEALGVVLKINILVLAPEHWQEYTGLPMYGILQTTDKQTVVVAGQNSELWAMIVPLLASLPSAAAQALQNVYGQADGGIDLAVYMNLLPIHEIEHLFIDQTADHFDFHLPYRWLVELFCNLCLYTYIFVHEPKLLSSLETFPQAVVAGEQIHLAYQALADFERLYIHMEPPNFIWYLSQLYVAAKYPYEAVSMETLAALHRLIVIAQVETPYDQPAYRLRQEVHPILAQILAEWPNLPGSHKYKSLMGQFPRN